jgi:hypothetical protein
MNRQANQERGAIVNIKLPVKFWLLIWRVKDRMFEEPIIHVHCFCASLLFALLES